MGKFIVGIILGLLIVPVFAYLYLSMGMFPAEASGPSLPFEKQLASMALDARIRRAGKESPPSPPTEADYLDGAKIYRDNCAFCHGLPNSEKPPAAKGEFPPPPQLMHGKGVTDDPVGETYWKVANGIRLTGMPGYRGSLSDQQIWHVSELLADMNKVSAGVKEILESPK